MKTTVEGLVSCPIILCYNSNFDKKKEKGKRVKKKEKKKDILQEGWRPNCVWTLVSLCGRVSLSHIHHH